MAHVAEMASGGSATLPGSLWQEATRSEGRAHGESHGPGGGAWQVSACRVTALRSVHRRSRGPGAGPRPRRGARKLHRSTWPPTAACPAEAPTSQRPGRADVSLGLGQRAAPRGHVHRCCGLLVVTCDPTRVSRWRARSVGTCRAMPVLRGGLAPVEEPPAFLQVQRARFSLVVEFRPQTKRCSKQRRTQLREAPSEPRPTFVSSAFTAELYLCLLEFSEVTCRNVACPCRTRSCPPGLSGHCPIPKPRVGRVAEAEKERMCLQLAPPWDDRCLGPG